MTVSLESNLAGLEAFLKSHPKEVLKATRRSLRRMLPTMAKASNAEIKKRTYKIATKDLRERTRRVKRLKGRFNMLEAGLAYSDKPLSLIRFVKGKKAPRKQKGIKVSRRRPIKVMVRPGNVSTLKRAFIAKARGGTFQVFRRRGDKMSKQSVPGLGRAITGSKVLQNRISFEAQRKLAKELPHNLKFFIDKSALKHEQKRSA